MKRVDLSLEEKIKLLVGSSDGNPMRSEGIEGKVRSLLMTDGPIGPHFPKPLLWMPSITCLSNTWNRDLVKEYVHAISDICVINKVDILLGPAVNIKKNPLCGRNFEYFSEDPYLTGELAKTYVITLQSRGISPCVKHFCANNREYSRLYCSSDMDLRTLREIYTKAFEIIMEADPWAIMCSYNRLNGEYVSQNEFVLRDVLRNSLHFNNVIVSDWGAVHDRGLALKASLDLEMPYPQWTNPIKSVNDALNKGIITEEDIDTSAERILQLIEKIDDNKSKRFVKYTDTQRHNIAVKTCEEGIVLLKNDDNILPLKNGKSIAVFGEHAIKPELGGGGSCNLGDDADKDFDKAFVTEQKGLPELLKKALPKSQIEYADGYQCHHGFGHHYRIYATVSVDRLSENSNIAIVVVGTNRTIECEGYDRENLELDSIQLDVINEVASRNENVIVIIEAGGVIDVFPFKDKVKAILYVPFGGEATNEAVANILSGKVSPSGKLTESFIRDVSVNPYLHKRNLEHETYDDGVFVGYRLYEYKGIEPEYPFGYGLSYSAFEYSDLEIVEVEPNGFQVNFSIKNIGKHGAKEISQLYVKPLEPTIERPFKELKGFIKTNLKTKEKKMATIELPLSAFAYFDEEGNHWKLDHGEYEILIGSSSTNIKLRKTIKIQLFSGILSTFCGVFSKSSATTVCAIQSCKTMWLSLLTRYKISDARANTPTTIICT